MEIIKKFESFINEELDPSTYQSAAKKLKEKGHPSRSEKLLKHQKDQVKNVKPVTFQMYGKEYDVDYNNVNIDGDGSIITINFNNVIIDYNNMTDAEIEDAEMDSVIWICEFYFKKGTTELIPDISGINIPDRKNALKLLKFLKEYYSYYGGPIEKEINKLTINDLYGE
jgi:hypothetical protein